MPCASRSRRHLLVRARVRDRRTQRGHALKPASGFFYHSARRPFTSLVRGLDPVFLENVGDRSAGDLMPKIHESAFDPRVAPSRIVASHAKHQLLNLSHHPWPPRASYRTVIPLPRDQPPVPGHDRVRRDDRRHVAQDLSTDSTKEEGTADRRDQTSRVTFAARQIESCRLDRLCLRRETMVRSLLKNGIVVFHEWA